jgi:hypothetical protein
MPSRRVITLVFAFWVATTGYVAYRDWWPRLFASGPPPVAIDLADEAAQNVPIRWTMTRNGEPIGRLITQMRYVESDDTFQFTSEYRQLKLTVAAVEFLVPEFWTTIRITRTGDLREQTAEGKLELNFHGLAVGSAQLKLVGRVTEGQLLATVDGSYSLLTKTAVPFRRTLDPVPVPAGQPLNPLQPVNRLRGVQPGQRWVVNESNPLDAAMKTLLTEVAGQFGIKPPEDTRGPLIGEVLRSPRDLEWSTQLVSCWVIEYRRDAEVVARTWLRQSDGKVLQQEALAKGEHLALVRLE